MIDLTGGGDGHVQELYPAQVETMELPDGLPAGIVSEFREAERCAHVDGRRAAVALLRSALEKILIENGYTKKKDGDLMSRINKAADERLITDARSAGLNDTVRSLANDILHDPWKAVSLEEYIQARKYVHRVIEDLYDQREKVVQKLTDLKRLLGTDNDEESSGAS
jgi:hypothetical protein